MELHRFCGPVRLCLLLLTICCASSGMAQLVLWGSHSYGQSRVPAQATNLLFVAGGDNQYVGLKADGSVLTWGSLDQTNVPAGLTDAIAIGVGSTHGCVLRADGRVKQLGSTLSGFTEKLKPPYTTNIVAIASGPGAQHVTVLREDGAIITWAAAGRTEAILDVPDSAVHLVDLGGGAFHLVGLKGDGTVVAWGDNAYGQTNVPAAATNVVAISVGFHHTAALRADGTVVVWGNGVQWPEQAPYNGSDFVAVSCSGETALALTKEGLPIHHPSGKYKPPASATNLASVGAASFGFAGLRAEGPPRLSRRMLPRTVLMGSSAFFRVEPVGARPFAYQWSHNGVVISGATNQVLVLEDVRAQADGTYTVAITNALGSVSADVPLTTIPAFIRTQPRPKAAFEGEDVSLSVAVDGHGPLVFMWFKDGVALPEATNSILTLSNIQLSQAGSYSVAVSNGFGTTTSQLATVTVDSILVTSYTGDQTWFKGGTTALSVSALSSEPISYQWRRHGADIPGAVSNSLSLENLSYDDSGWYSVVLSNTLGVTEVPRQLIVTAVAQWPTLSKDGRLFLPPDSTNLVAISTGAYYWAGLRKDGTVITWGLLTNGMPTPFACTDAISVAAGWSHVLALRKDGTVLAWGDNYSGCTDVPSTATNIVAIDACGSRSFALQANGRVIFWGNPSSLDTDRLATATNVVAMCGNLFLCADGTVVDANATRWLLDVREPPLSDVIQVSAHENVRAALRANGSVVVWGDAGVAGSAVPESATNIVRLAAGWNHCSALRADGSVMAWGNSQAATNMPAGLRGVMDISAYTVTTALLGDEPFVLHPHPEKLGITNGTFQATVRSQCGRVYALECKDSLDDPQWTLLPLVAGTGSEITLSDPTAGAQRRFYRLRKW